MRCSIENSTYKLAHIWAIRKGFLVYDCTRNAEILEKSALFDSKSRFEKVRNYKQLVREAKTPPKLLSSDVRHNRHIKKYLTAYFIGRVSRAHANGEFPESI